MVYLYTIPSYKKCQKVKSWLSEHKINYIERDIVKDPLTITELKKLSKKSENGIPSFINKTSNLLNKFNINMCQNNIKKILQTIVKHPELLSLPIVVNNNDLLIGCDNKKLNNLMSNEQINVQLILNAEQLNI